MSFRALLASVGRSMPCAGRLRDWRVVVDWLWHATRCSPERSSRNLIIVAVFPNFLCNELLRIGSASTPFHQGVDGSDHSASQEIPPGPPESAGATTLSRARPPLLAPSR